MLDGKGLGTTPKVLQKLRTGKHVLELTRDGHIAWVGQPVVRAGKQTEVVAKMQAVPPPPPPLPPPPKAEPKETGPLELSPEISFDRKLVSGQQPEAPRITSGRVSGSVLVKIVVGLSGAVESMDIVQSGGDILDGAVQRAVARWKYKPATKNGTPVRVFFLYRFTFK
jgi:TonB family protein